MPIQSSITAIEVTGTYKAVDGSPLNGFVTFKPSTTVTDSTGKVVVPAGGLVVGLDDNGTFSVSLMATDDPQWAAPNWTYTVTETFFGYDGTRTRESYSIAVPAASPGGMLDLSEAPRIASNAPAPAYFLPLAGGTVTGDVTITGDLTVTGNAAVDRVVDAGEFVLPRRDIITETPVSSGNLYVTHFRAARTETIQTIRTGVGSGVATGATHAWLGIMSWDGSVYTPVAASVDDPTRWTSGFQSYNTQIFQWDHAGEDAFKGWDKVADLDYVLWLLWIGSGTAPSLPAGGGWFADSLESPRTNGYTSLQTQPPAAPISGAFFGLDSRRFQGLMLR